MPTGNKAMQKPETTPESFFIWFDKLVEDLGFPSERQVAIKAGLAPSVISKARTGAQPIGLEACFALASALGVSEEIVFKEAGWLPKPVGYSSEVERLKELVKDAEPDELRHYIRIIQEIKALRGK